MTFSDSIIETISNTNSSRPSTPNITIKNPVDRLSFINKLEIFPSLNFATNGILQIYLDGITLFDNSNNVGFFQKFKSFAIPLNANELKRSGRIEIFSWNGNGSTLIEATISVLISEINQPQFPTSIPNQQEEDFENLFSDEDTLTTPDGGSGVIATIYECPANKIAVVKTLNARVKNTGSASLVNLSVRGTSIKTWKVSTLNPYEITTGLDVNVGYKPTAISVEVRNVYSNGSYPEANKTYEDLKEEKLIAGETIAFTGNFSGNFNATCNYSITVEERDA